ncbi:MAG: hypothetical protein H7844_05820 [Nitrospirae bacterium YQR-1]
MNFSRKNISIKTRKCYLSPCGEGLDRGVRFVTNALPQPLPSREDSDKKNLKIQALELSFLGGNR